jgi:guanyl-specific ribonuclease Sa
MGYTPDARVTCHGSGNAEDGVAYGAYVLRNVDVDDPIAVAAVLNGPKTFVNPSATAITTVDDGSLVVAVGCGQYYDSTPGNLADQFFGYTGTSAYVDDTRDITIAAGMKNQYSAGSCNPGTWYSWNNQGLTGLVATFAFNRKVEDDATRYWVGGTGSWIDDTNHWATESGGTPGFGNLPDEVTDVVFDENSFSAADQTVSVDSNYNTSAVYSVYMTHMPTSCKDISFADVTNTPTLEVERITENALIVRGSLDLNSEMSLSGAGEVSMEGDGDVTLNTYGLDSDFVFSIGDTLWIHGGTTRCVLEGDLIGRHVFVGSSGWLKSMSYDITTPFFLSDGKTDLGTSTVTISVLGTNTFSQGTGGAFQVWNSSVDFNSASSTIVFDNTGSNANNYLTLDPEGHKFHNFEIIGTGDGYIYFDDGATFDNFEIRVPAKLVFYEGYTFNFTEFTAYGNSTGKVEITSGGTGQSTLNRI